MQNPPAEITVTVRTPITIRVPSDQPKIQSAIDVAAFGDTVLVAPGTYVENINFGGKAITVTSESGPQVTIIDGRKVGSVVSFISGEGRDSTLNGFTLQNGLAGLSNQGIIEGGGITVQGSSPTITNNVIRNNRACNGYGHGIGIDFGSPLIRLNTITDNGDGSIRTTCGGSGGGISIRGASSVEILDNMISDNISSNGGGIFMMGVSGAPIIKRNIIKGNNAITAGFGGGISMVNSSDALIVQNLITGNEASEGGGLYWFVSSASRGPILVNNTIADNNAIAPGSSIFVEGNNSRTELTNNIIVAKLGQTGLHCGDLSGQNPPIIRFNNIFSAGGMAYGGSCSDKTGTDGNISTDPRFTNPTQGDYHLQQGSPSIDAGDNLTPNLPDKDLDGHPRILDGDGNGTEIVDMGVDEFRMTSITIRVPSDQPKIQSAIDVATYGDTVLVAPGTYTENINFRGKAITVTSESGPQVTIIDGRGAGSVVVFTSGERRDSVLNGFTLQNGGGGITVEGSSPTITNNVIKFNRSCAGGGIRIDSGSPLIRLNTITGNGSLDFCGGSVGGGISIQGVSSVEVLDNVISGNTILSFRPGLPSGGGAGIYMSAVGTPIIKGNVIKGNDVAGGKGGGISIVKSTAALIVQNLITGNRADDGGGLYYLVSPGPGPFIPRLVNNTIADNDSISNGSGIFADGSGSGVELTNNIIVAKPGQTGLHCGDLSGQTPITRFNNIFSAGGMAYGGTCSDKTGMDGNISADPLFTNPTQGDYHLQQGSPSIDAGDNLTPNLPDKDLDGRTRILDGDGNGTEIVDMGVFEFLAPSSFGVSLQGESNGNMLKINWPLSVYSMPGNYPWRRRKSDREWQPHRF